MTITQDRMREIEGAGARLYTVVCSRVLDEINRQQLTEADLSRKLGWTEESLRKFLHGDARVPSLYVVAAFERALGKRWDLSFHDSDRPA